MEFRAQQINPPRDWSLFEDLCQALFAKVWNNPTAQKNGRRGQAQHGVDVYGYPDGGAFLHGVQCKGKDASYGAAVTIDEVLKEMKKADSFQPSLSHWIFATTAPVDATLQKLARELSSDREQQGLFTVEVLGWGALVDLLDAHREVAERFYPQHVFDVPGILRALSVGSNASIVRPHVDWVGVTFDTSRDLGPALMGRPLGPSDAISCPRLEEADTLAHHLLRPSVPVW